MDKIIIASNGHNTRIMINGKVYGDHVMKVEFVHDNTLGMPGVANYLLTTDKAPLEESATKEEFMKLLELLAGENEFLKKSPKANTLRNYKTCELVEELKTREGVETHWAEPYEDKNIQVNGPSLVLVVID